MKLIQIISKIIKFVSVNKLNIIVLIYFTYQLIELTIKYTQYETITNVEIDYYAQQVPSLAFCYQNEIKLKKYIKQFKKYFDLKELIFFFDLSNNDFMPLNVSIY